LARIVAIANEYLGDNERAMRWLKHPNRASAASYPSLPSTQSWERAKWRASWAASPMAELVEPVISSLTQDVCPCSFDGEGAYRYGGRWSSPGTRLSYTSEHQSLAMLEYFIHLDVDDPPGDLVLAVAEVPDDIAASGLKPALCRQTGANLRLPPDSLGWVMICATRRELFANGALRTRAERKYCLINPHIPITRRWSCEK